MKIKKLLFLTSAVALGAAASYTYLLDDEAKENLSGLKDTVLGSYREIKGMVEDFLDEFVLKDDVVENQQQVRNEWKEIGY